MNTSSKSAKNKSHGFGIVELVIVVSVIGILAALALPMISMVKHSSHTNKSKRNAQQLVSLCATAVASGDESIPAASSKEDAIQLIVSGLDVDGIHLGLPLSQDEINEASKYLALNDGLLYYIDMTDGDVANFSGDANSADSDLP